MSSSTDQILRGQAANRLFQIVMSESVLVQIKADGIFTLGFETSNNSLLANQKIMANYWELEMLSYFTIGNKKEWITRYRQNRQAAPSQGHRAKLSYQLGRLGLLMHKKVSRASINEGGDISLDFGDSEVLQIRGKENVFDISWALTCLNHDHQRTEYSFQCNEVGEFFTNVTLK